jgi:hypothetical protein
VNRKRFLTQPPPSSSSWLAAPPRGQTAQLGRFSSSISLERRMCVESLRYYFTFS